MRTAFKIGGESVNIPCGWHELTVSQFRNISSIGDNDAFRFVSVITGIEERKLFNYDVSGIVGLCSWIFSEAEAEQIKRAEPTFTVTFRGGVYEMPKEPTECTFGQKMVVSAMGGKSGVDVADTIFATYLQPIHTRKEFSYKEAEKLLPDVGRLPVLVVLPYARYMAERIAAIEKAQRAKLPSAHDAKQLQAGVENLFKYGDFATLDTLANGDPTKYKEIESLQWSVVLLKSAFNAEKNEVERNLIKNYA